MFDAQGTGVLSLSNVLMGAASSASGTGTIRFAGGTSRVAPGAGYAAGITELGRAACSISTTTAAPARCAWRAMARAAATAR